MYWFLLQDFGLSLSIFVGAYLQTEASAIFSGEKSDKEKRIICGEAQQSLGNLAEITIK